MEAKYNFDQNVLEKTLFQRNQSEMNKGREIMTVCWENVNILPECFLHCGKYYKVRTS